MASVQFMAPGVNFPQTTLNGAINSSAETITLTSATNIKAPSYAVIDRENSAGTATPNSREVIYFTGISGSDLTGCSRGADGSTARAHNDGAIVEFVPTVGMWNSLATIVYSALDGSGYLKAINSPVSIAIGRFTQFDTPSIASIAEAKIERLFASGATITTSLNVSGASVVGFRSVRPVFVFVGNLSGPTTLLQTPVTMPQSGNWRYINIITRTVASGASAIIDVNKNGTSIFDAGTRPPIAGGGTFVSTASIATKGFNEGDRMSWDYDTTGGHVTDLDVILVGE